MKIKPILCLLVAFSCLTGSQIIAADTQTRPEVPNDFAFGATLNVETDAPFFRTVLSDEVYLRTAWQDLRDIRVFNEQGQPLPYSLVHYDNVLDETTVVPMTLFSMTGQVKNERNGNERVASLTTPDGVTVNVPLQSNQSVGRSYLLKVPDNVDKRRSPNRLTLTWPKNNKNWQTQVSLYYSESAQYWNPVVINAPLMDLTSGDEKLLIDNIELGSSQRYNIAYYLLVFKEDKDNPPPLIEKVEAVYFSQHRENELISLPFTGSSTGNGQAEYYLPTPQPLQTLSILPKQTNAVLPLEVEYRSNESADWRALPKQVVYKLVNNNGEKVSSTSIELNDRLVQGIRIKAVNSSWGNDLPDVSGGRKQMMLVFNAQGNAPYLLAWGAKAAQAQSIPVESLVPASIRGGKNLASLPSAWISRHFALGGESRLQMEEQDDARWQTFLLWGVLILGVAGLSLFAFKIWQEMKQKSGKIGSDC